MSHFNKDSFKSLIDNDKNLFQSLLELFVQEWPAVLEKIKKGLHENNSKQVEQNGHRLKGNLRNFYANEMAKLASKIEEAGREENLTNVKPFIDELESQLYELETELNQFYSEFSG